MQIDETLLLELGFKPYMNTNIFKLRLEDRYVFAEKRLTGWELSFYCNGKSMDVPANLPNLLVACFEVGVSHGREKRAEEFRNLLGL